MEKKEIMAKFATHEGDPGSPEVQIALLTERINHLNMLPAWLEKLSNSLQL